MPLDRDDQLKTLLAQARSVAVVGASAKAERPSYGVMRALLAHGYTVYPVNPGLAGQELQGRQVYARLEDVPERVDIVDIFRASDAAGEAVDEAIASGAGAVWLQLGIEAPAALARAEQAGLRTVQDRCIKIELARLAIAARS